MLTVSVVAWLIEHSMSDVFVPPGANPVKLLTAVIIHELILASKTIVYSFFNFLDDL
jgi:hypothetical protein